MHMSQYVYEYVYSIVCLSMCMWVCVCEYVYEYGMCKYVYVGVWVFLSMWEYVGVCMSVSM